MTRDSSGQSEKGKRRTPRAKTASQDDAFFSLAENAFEFLSRSIQDFEASPRFSVVNFCAALEMLLKARLMREHWSLTLAKPESANRDDFLKGNFGSVTLEQAWVRLKNVVGLPLPDAAYRSFVDASKHRNKLIHFFHPDLAKDESAKTQIVSEQARAWFHLHRLLEAWPEFDQYRGQIQAAERGLRRHRKYLVAKHEVLAPELDSLRKQGRQIASCQSCELDAAVGRPLNRALTSWHCAVCEVEQISAMVVCPHCGRETELSASHRCNECHESISSEEVATFFVSHDAAWVAAKDGDSSLDRGNCSWCDSYHTVCVFHAMADTIPG